MTGTLPTTKRALADKSFCLIFSAMCPSMAPNRPSGREMSGESTTGQKACAPAPAPVKSCVMARASVQQPLALMEVRADEAAEGLLLQYQGLGLHVRRQRGDEGVHEPPRAGFRAAQAAVDDQGFSHAFFSFLSRSRRTKASSATRISSRSPRAAASAPST